MTISVHAVDINGKIYAVEIDRDAKQIVTIFDVHNWQFVDYDLALESRIADFYTLEDGLLPPMEYSQWLRKEAEDLLLLNDEEFTGWVNQMKAYCDRRRRYCLERKYPPSLHFPLEKEIQPQLYPHWTWFLCANIKEIKGRTLLMRYDDCCFNKQDTFREAMWKWEQLTGLKVKVATAVE